MKTRSQMKNTELPVLLDFDEASDAWRRNKKVVNGYFVYVCGFPLKSVKVLYCKRPLQKNGEYCINHNNNGSKMVDRIKNRACQ
jgi:hypothetical protein